MKGLGQLKSSFQILPSPLIDSQQWRALFKEFNQIFSIIIYINKLSVVQIEQYLLLHTVQEKYPHANYIEKKNIRDKSLKHVGK